MKAKIDPAVCSFGAGVLNKHQAALRQEIAGVRLGQDIEAIHRMRVASRRLRSALELFETCYPAKYRALWAKEIRQVTRLLGQARDNDVQQERLAAFLAGLQESLPRSGVRRLALRWRQKREKLQVGVVKTLDELEKSHTLDSLEAQTSKLAVMLAPGEPVSYALYRLSKDAIQAKLDEFIGLEGCLATPEAVAEIHAMRIAAKRLRYTLEIFSPLYANELKGAISAVKTAQEMLGEIHDCDAWAMMIPVFLEKERQRILRFYGHTGFYTLLLPGINAFQEDLAKSRASTFSEFTETWEGWKNKDLWGGLTATLDLPLSHDPAQVFYPPAAAAMELPEAPPPAVEETA